MIAYAFVGNFWSEPAHAATCFADVLGANVFVQIARGAPSQFDVQMNATNVQGIFVTNVHFEGEFDGAQLKLRASFDTKDVGLPYNFQAILIADGESTLLWKDFTDDCKGVPPSLFPGHSLELMKMDLPSNVSSAGLHIVVWGGLY
jgi:hypothetical protein